MKKKLVLGLLYLLGLLGLLIMFGLAFFLEKNKYKELEKEEETTVIMNSLHSEMLYELDEYDKVEALTKHKLKSILIKIMNSYPGFIEEEKKIKKLEDKINAVTMDLAMKVGEIRYEPKKDNKDLKNLSIKEIQDLESKFKSAISYIKKGRRSVKNMYTTYKKDIKRFYSSLHLE